MENLKNETIWRSILLIHGEGTERNWDSHDLPSVNHPATAIEEDDT
jgi:hypothetical protein